MNVSVCGDSIYTVLRIDGEEAHTLNLHPNLLQGPFVIEGRSYRVERQEIVRRDMEQVVPTSTTSLFDGEEIIALNYSREMIPSWIVVLDMVAQ